MKGIADYEFVQLLGEGNHGQFWKARTPARLGIDDEFVAVKTLAQQATEDDFRRMANELRLYSSVESPYLVQLFDAGHQDGRLYYAAQYLPDGSLGVPARPLGRTEVLRAVMHAARAAHALHEVGVAHRDIKPDNILLDGDIGRLGDLGLAQIVNRGQTVTGIGPVGAIEYLAPEVIRGTPASRASDVWALGATLHRALTGRSMYPTIPEDTLLNALRHVLATEPTPEQTLSEAERGLIVSCLAPDPADRPRTAAEFADRVEALLGQETSA